MQEAIDIKSKRMNVLKTYGENFQDKNYITNPAIGRDEQIKQLILILLTPDKSAVLVGKPGVGKTATVEGIAYRIQMGLVPDVLKGYSVVKINTSSLLGVDPVTGEAKVQILLDELKNESKLILFIDEIHTLIGSYGETSMDLANILKPAIDRGAIKLIGASTDIEYNTYIIRDRAFLRRFERIDVSEPDEPTTVEILLKSLPKIEASTGIKFKYNEYVTKMILESIVSATSEYKRVYGLGAMYPDISFSVLTAAFSQALFQNRELVTVEDVYNAIKESKRIYPDSIIRELTAFREKFSDVCAQDGIQLPVVDISELNTTEYN